MKEPTNTWSLPTGPNGGRWLEQHHADETRPGSCIPEEAAKRYLGYEEGVEEALCFGWIDGRLRVWMLKLRASILPAQEESTWAPSNKIRAEG